MHAIRQNAARSTQNPSSGLGGGTVLLVTRAGQPLDSLLARNIGSNTATAMAVFCFESLGSGTLHVRALLRQKAVCCAVATPRYGVALGCGGIYALGCSVNGGRSCTGR
jgi:hypothetical protein